MRWSLVPTWPAPAAWPGSRGGWPGPLHLLVNNAGNSSSRPAISVISRWPGGCTTRWLRGAYTVPNDAELADHPHGVKEWALDPDAARELWAGSRATLSR
jgi:hypothetical protein